MNRQAAIAGGLVGLGVVAVVGLWGYQRRQEQARMDPPWLQSGQPDVGVANQLTTVDAGRSRAANGCPPFAAPCTGRTVGLNTRRTYAPTLSDDPNSLVVGLNFQVGC